MMWTSIGMGLLITLAFLPFSWSIFGLGVFLFVGGMLAD